MSGAVILPVTSSTAAIGTNVMLSESGASRRNGARPGLIKATSPRRATDQRGFTGAARGDLQFLRAIRGHAPPSIGSTEQAQARADVRSHLYGLDSEQIDRSRAGRCP